MTSKPEIRINYAHLLHGVSIHLDDYFNPSESQLASEAQCMEWTASYRAAWAKYEVTILGALHEILGLEFYRDVFDVSLAQYFTPQSDPLIMNFQNKPDLFVDVLAHELIHVLLTDNNVMQLNAHKNSADLAEEWSSLFGSEHNFGTLVHIPVHAVLESLYLDYLHDESRLKRDIKGARNLTEAEGYAAAWRYVNGKDYKAIINKLRRSYDEIKG